MWKGWGKYVDRPDAKRYELMVDFGTRYKIRLGAYITKVPSQQKKWSVLINTFAPTPGETIIYEDHFESFEDAEQAAWKRAEQLRDLY